MHTLSAGCTSGKQHGCCVLRKHACCTLDRHAGQAAGGAPVAAVHAGGPQGSFLAVRAVRPRAHRRDLCASLRARCASCNGRLGAACLTILACTGVPAHHDCAACGTHCTDSRKAWRRASLLASITLSGGQGSGLRVQVLGLGHITLCFLLKCVPCLLQAVGRLRGQGMHRLLGAPGMSTRTKRVHLVDFSAAPDTARVMAEACTWCPVSNFGPASRGRPGGYAVGAQSRGMPRPLGAPGSLTPTKPGKRVEISARARAAGSDRSCGGRAAPSSDSCCTRRWNSSEDCTHRAGACQRRLQRVLQAPRV